MDVGVLDSRTKSELKPGSCRRCTNYFNLGFKVETNGFSLLYPFQELGSVEQDTTESGSLLASIASSDRHRANVVVSMMSVRIKV